MDWLEDSVSFLPSFLGDPYNSGSIDDCPWWDESQYLAQDLLDHTLTNSLNTTPFDTSPNPTTTASNKSGETPDTSPNLHQLPIPVSSRKRKSSDNNNNTSNHPKNSIRRNNRRESGNSNNKEGRWAEQLLYPCAAALTEGNFTRVQHLLYVLHELASLSGDANHRLAHHGLQALTHHISPSSVSSTDTFATTEPRLFQRSLIKFNEVSPWFAFPNSLANSAILQLLSEEKDPTRGVHIIDIGVSHGVQWPTLLETLARRPGGPPPLVRITSSASSYSDATPFSSSPPGHDSSSRLLAFAKSISLNLEIAKLDSKLVEFEDESSDNEILIICTQFRLQGLSHDGEREEFLNWARKMRPRGVIVSESEGFGEGFEQRVEWLWRFLESTSAAFKGRESEERRVVEGEAARGLMVTAGSDGREGWCRRMRGAGFDAVALAEDAVDGGRALLRKYDGNWEMKVDDNGGDGFVGLCWKGQPVSFCSLWKLSDS